MHDVVEDDGKPVLVMEFVPARTLADRIAGHGAEPGPASDVLALGATQAGTSPHTVL